MTTIFTEKVLSIVKRIPRGSTLSYGQVATSVGSPRAGRAVGSILKGNFDSTVPCHRVIKSDGTAGQYNRGTERKIAILRSEGAIK